MKALPIVPTRYLYLLDELNFRNHMVLAHIYEEDESYRYFYQQQRKKGAFIILDNSAHELEVGYDQERLARIARDLHPDVVVVPDVRGNGKESLVQAGKFTPALFPPKTKFMVVFHSIGKDWKGPWNYLLNLPYADYVGLNKSLQKLEVREFLARKAIIHPFRPKVHFLGCLAQIHSQVIGIVESMDTSLPFQLAIEARDIYDTEPATMKVNFNMAFYEALAERARVNLKAYKQLVEGT